MAKPEDTCRQCGTTAYTRADMVGDVCPPCSKDNELATAADEAVAVAVAAQEKVDAARKERAANAQRVAEAEAAHDTAAATVETAMSGKKGKAE
jgi:uncharacterized Zn finger protein (UPF0148 family)